MRSLSDLPALVDDRTVNVVVESPRGSALKFKFDQHRLIMTLSRPLPEGLVYQHDWGFIPSTRAADGDPLDVIVVWDGVSYPGVVIECRPIGVLRVDQTNRDSGARERNDRLVALPTAALRWESVNTVFDLPERARSELEQFFLGAVAFEGKDLRILGWGSPADAIALVRAST